MRHIIITGSTSFIGLNLIKLLKKNKDIFLHLVVRKNSKKNILLENMNNVKIYEIDMSDYLNIGNYINIVPDCLIHLSWNGTRKPERNYESIQKNNYINSINLFESIYKKGCKKIIGIGSQAEYGIKNFKINENTEAKPNTYYGIYKLKTCEEGINLFKNTEVEFYWLRVFSLYGVGDYEKTLVMDTILKSINNEDVNFTEATQNWNFLNVKDAVSAIEFFINNSVESGVYNLGSKITKKLKDFILDIKSILNSDNRLLFGSLEYSDEGKIAIDPDVTKILNNTEWKEEISFEQGIKEIITEIKKHNEKN